MSEQGGDQEAPDQSAMEAAIKEAMSKYVSRPPKGQPLKAQPQPATPFEKFTERAREALSLARDEATRFNHNYIGTEHILLGLLREGEGVGALALTRMGVGLDAVRDALEYIIGRGDRMIVGDIGLTPRAKKVIELAVDEARRTRQSHVGTEHLLLGLVREGEGIAANVLKQFGVTTEGVRLQIVAVMEAGGRAAEPLGPRANVVTCRVDDRDLDAIDALVEAGIRSTRSDAASWLISAGIDAHRELFERVYATVAEIRNLRAEAQSIAQQLAAGEQEPAPPEPGEPSSGDDEPPAASAQPE
jgi:Clp amino terminal domain, pathogenicity island component